MPGRGVILPSPLPSSPPSSGSPLPSIPAHIDDNSVDVEIVEVAAHARARTPHDPAVPPSQPRSRHSVGKVETSGRESAAAAVNAYSDMVNLSPANHLTPPQPLPPSSSTSSLPSLPDVDRPSLASLLPLYFPADFHHGMSAAEMKKLNKYQVTLVMSKFFHRYRKRFILESDVRLHNRVVLDYPTFCAAIDPYMAGFESQMKQTPHVVLKILQCALHHTCIMHVADTGGNNDVTAQTSFMSNLVHFPLLVRFRSFRPRVSLHAASKASRLGHFVSVQGTVVRTQAMRPAVVSMEFECQRCKTRVRQKFDDQIYSAPIQCTPPCYGRAFEPDRTSAVFVDLQWIKLQEIVSNAAHKAPLQSTSKGEMGSSGDAASSASSSTADPEFAGRVPRTLEVRLLGSDLIDVAIPGDVVSICGMMRMKKQDAGIKGRNTAVFFSYIDANFVEKASSSNGNGTHPSGDDAMAAEARRHDMIKSEHDSWASSLFSSGPSPSMSSSRPFDPLAELHPSELAAIQKVLTSTPNPIKLLVASLCPTIYGNEGVKAGLLLSLLGGVSKSGGVGDGDSGTSVRGDIHVLCVGDPGLGKSQMLRAAAHAAPRGVYVSGGVATKTGLTVTMVREGKDGDFALEAGALVLADQGCCCIDEFDKMTAEHNALLEAMEQQSISIAKAGMVCNLAARAAVIAAANPVGGHYNRAKTVSENLKIGSPLLSRFDLIFILLDRPDMERDQMLSEHIVAFHGRDSRRSTLPLTPPRACRTVPSSASLSSSSSSSSSSSAPSFSRRLVVALNDPDVIWRANVRGEAEVDALPIPLLRKYIAYARKYCKPVLSSGARRVLADFYLSLRGRGNSSDGTPITTRQLEALIRLSEARARADMVEIVSVQHAQDVVDLMQECMRDVVEDETEAMMDIAGMRGVTTGGGVASRGGMSKAALKKKFVTILRNKVEAKGDPTFTAQELYALHEDLNMKYVIDDFGAFIDSLNMEGFLLKSGPRSYKLTVTM